MEEKLNFQVPAEGLELVILLHALYAHHFLLKPIFIIFTFEKNINFCSENLLNLFSSLWIS